MLSSLFGDFCLLDKIMEKQTIKFEDNSGDKEFFTIIPNYVLNHSTSTDQSLYSQLKRLAGESGDKTCYPSFKYLKKQMGVGSAKLKESFKYLIKYKWIDDLGKRQVPTKGGSQWINVYRVNNIWKMNMDYYHNKSKGVSNQTPLEETKGVPEMNKGIPESAKGCPVIGAKERTYKRTKERTLATKVAEKISINDLIDLFKDINPSYEKLFKNKTQRSVIERLVAKFGELKLKKLIKILPKTNKMQYAPSITTPLQLEDKMGSLKVFLEKRETEINNNKPIIL